MTSRSLSTALVVVTLAIVLSGWKTSSSQEAPAQAPLAEEDSLPTMALSHMRLFEMQLAARDQSIELLDRPLLTYGDSARANQNGTLWAFGKTGRPLAMLELYQGMDKNPNWVHAMTLTGAQTISLKTPLGTKWSPATTQIQPVSLADAPPPDSKELRRLRQMKDLARRFTAHEFWDPDNSRFELRLLVQPVHRYSDPAARIQYGGTFVLAHGTNPEVILLIEALGSDLETARWHYSLARLGSAELHVELDGEEVWKRDRTPGVVGRPTDPYWLFVSPVEAKE